MPVQVIIECNHGAIDFIRVVRTVSNSIATLGYRDASPFQASKFIFVALKIFIVRW